MSDPWAFLIIVICGVIGYGLVSAFLSKRRSEDDERAVPKEKRNDETFQHWWEILSVSESASFEEIQRAFRIEIAKYHPDRVANLGPELRELAERRSKAINQAYTFATKRKGGSRR